MSAQECLQAAERRSTPLRNQNSSAKLPIEIQAIITSYKFGCCGNIIAWQAYMYVQPGGGMYKDGAYDITFQVWRPSPTVQQSGCYTLVGQNRFTRISLGSNGLVRETPEPSNILSVEPNDVVGYFSLSRNDQESKKGEGMQLDTSQSIESVWYHTNTNMDPLIIGAPNCPLPVGTEAILISSTNVAPVLSMNVCKISSFTLAIQNASLYYCHLQLQSHAQDLHLLYHH